MSDYKSISDAGKALAKLLWDSISSDSEARSIVTSYNDISLSSPEEIKDEKLSIFLYRMAEDAHLKNQSMEVSGPEELKYPHVSLSLFFMITAHTQNVEKDHMLIGKVIQIFNDNPVLRSPLLEGNLAGEELRLVINSMSLDELNKIWTMVARAKPYRLSAFYEVFSVRIDSTRRARVKRVVEKIVDKSISSGEEMKN